MQRLPFNFVDHHSPRQLEYIIYSDVWQSFPIFLSNLGYQCYFIFQNDHFKIYVTLSHEK